MEVELSVGLRILGLRRSAPRAAADGSRMTRERVPARVAEVLGRARSLQDLVASLKREFDAQQAEVMRVLGETRAELRRIEEGA